MIVEDIPLLVESGMAPMFPLVIIVNADEDLRVKRLIEHRGFSEEDARARIKAQATEEQRRAVADVWLDNSGSADELVDQARDLWHQRIVPFEHNLDAGEPARSRPVLVPHDPSWPDQARRIAARLNTACGHRAVRIDHIGSTAVPGLDAKDVIDMQVTVASFDVADELAEALTARATCTGRSRTTRPSRTPAAPSPSSTTPTTNRCGRSGFTRRPILVGRPMSICGSTAGPISSSRAVRRLADRQS